jgi:nucleoporin SEH1
VSSFGKALSLSASISLNPQKAGSQESSFLVGFNSNTPELNSSKVTKSSPNFVPVISF